MVAWCDSDQNILLQAPSLAVVCVPLSASVRVRQPLICMILMFDHDRARRWRTSGSRSAPGRLGGLEDLVELLWKRRCPVVAEVPRSKPSVVMATFHPLLTPPMTLSLGQRTLVKKTSLNSAEPSICSMGRTSTPGCFIGTSRYEMPACFGASGSVRAKQEDVVGILRLGRPDLLAVDDPFVAVEFGSRLEAGQVRPGVGLAEPLAPGDLALEDARDELPLLLLGAPLQDGRPDEGVAEEVAPQRRAGAGELLVEHDLLEEGEALAAVLGRASWRRSSRRRRASLVHSSLKALRSSGVMEKSGISPAARGRLSCSQAAISDRNSSASGGYVRSIPAVPDADPCRCRRAAPTSADVPSTRPPPG